MNVTENDMNSATKVISDLWSAAVEGSKLAEEFKSFREQVASETRAFQSSIDEMKRDVEYVRERNARLDSENADLRKQRDEYASSLVQAQADRDNFKSELTNAQARINSQVEVLKTMDEKIDRLTKERDESIQEVLELEQKNKELSDRLEAVRTAMGFLASPTTAPAPTAKDPQPMARADQPTTTVSPIAPSPVAPSDSGDGGGQLGHETKAAVSYDPPPYDGPSWAR